HHRDRSNSGIDFIRAFELARHGGDVVLACRNPERSAAAAEAIREEMKTDPGYGQIEEITLDTSLESSVKTFSDEFLKHHQKLDILVNNAGSKHFPGQLFMLENKHSETTVYGNSNVFFAFVLGCRLESAGISNITSVACHLPWARYPHCTPLSLLK
ncbi:hypothetical protein JG687_00017838, partial [Phytophthora cactorum]